MGAALMGAVAMGVMLVAPDTYAQEICGDPPAIPADFGSLIEQYPSHNSRDIPRDGFVRFVYRGRAPNRAIVVVTDENGALVQGTLAVVGSELHWRAGSVLRALTTYTARAPDISGGDQLVRFTTGTVIAADRITTGFDGIVNVTSERIGATDICRDDNAREVTVSWKFARESPWPQSELTYIVYETRGPGVGAPIVRSADRGRLSTTSCAQRADQCVTFRLSSANSAGGACFSVQVYDPRGQGMPNLIEKCINLDSGNFFNGCSIQRTSPVAHNGSQNEDSFNHRALIFSLVATLGFATVLRAKQRSG